MKQTISQRRLDLWFNIILIFKGIDGALELVSGTLLLLIPNTTIRYYVVGLADSNALETHDFLSNALASFSHTFSHNVQTYTAIYLLLHGIIKVGLVIALLSRKYALYPAAIVMLILFMVYQVYRIFTQGQVLFDGALTVIDGIVVWLTILEYRRHQAQPDLPTG